VCVCVYVVPTYATRGHARLLSAKVAFGPAKVLLLYARHMWVRPIGSSFPFVQAFSSVPRPVRDECYTSVCTSVYIQACTSVYMRIHACTSVYKCVQAYTSLCKRVPACKSVYNSSVYFNTSVRVYMCTRVQASVYNCYLVCTRVCTRVRVQVFYTRVQLKCIYTSVSQGSVYKCVHKSVYRQACRDCVQPCYKISVLYKYSIYKRLYKRFIQACTW
jgi:hypothetical protein